MLVSDITQLREKVPELIDGELNVADATDLLRQTGQDNLSGELLDLFVGVIKARVAQDAAPLIKELKVNGNLFDCSGTGGSGLPHFNTSTTVAFVLAAAGVPVAKFGNRAAGSLSGSFDFLDRLGIGDSLSISQMSRLFSQTNMLFLYAPQFYPTLARLAPIRKELGIRTVLNLIGPLLNPVEPPFRMLGTPQLPANKMIADHLCQQSHIRRGVVVSSVDGLDEMELSTNHVHKIEPASVNYELHSFNCHGKPVKLRPSEAMSVDNCCRIFSSLLNNELPDDDYFHRIVCLNSGMALFVAEKASSVEEGYNQASELISNGAVKKTFESYRRAYAAIPR